MSDINSIGTSYSYGQNTLNSTQSSSSATNSNEIVSAPTSYNSANLLRITGMATGLDVDSMVSKLMAPYQMQIDKVQQDVQKVQWRQQMYQGIISDVKNFQSTYFNVQSPDMNITSSSFFNAMNASSSDNNLVSVTASSTATVGNYSVSVNSMASSASITGNTLNSQIKIGNFNNWKTGADNNSGSITFNINGTSASINLSSLNVVNTGNIVSDNAQNTNNLVSMINGQIASNAALSGKVTVSSITDDSGTYIKFTNIGNTNGQIEASNIMDINSDAASNTSLQIPLNLVSVNNSTTLSQLGFSGTGTLQLSYNNTTASISVTDTESLSQLEEDINSKTSGAVRGAIDDITGKFTIQTVGTGSNNTISITNTTSDNLLKVLGMSNGPSSAQGNDASVTIVQPGGKSETISENSNTFSLNGIDFNIKNTTSSSVDVNVSSDVNSVVNKFKDFMDKYNKIVTEINTKINEKVSYDYPPLTSSQKSQMSASDIQAWNAKAQVGLLHNDDNLSNMLSDLKNTFFDAVKDASVYFGSNIGVDLSSDISTDTSTDGTIVFTDGTGDTFKQALKSHGTEIANLFTQFTNSTDTNKYNDEGIFQRINDVFVKNTGMAGIVSNDSTLGSMAYKQDDFSMYGGSGTNTFLDQLYRDKNQINKLQQTYDDKKNQYYKQFTDLETAMNQLNAQSAQLIQQMGGSQ